MKKRTMKLLGIALAGVMTMGMLAGCGGSQAPAGGGQASESGAAPAEDNQAPEGDATVEPSGDKIKIGVLVQDVSGEEALGFRSYYENYIANNYNVEFLYTDAIDSAEMEASELQKFIAQGCKGIISISGNDKISQLETCEENGVYYVLPTGTLDGADDFDTYKGYEYFVGQVGPSMNTEFEAGKAMGEFYKAQGVKNVAVYGAFIPNPMHVYRTAGTLIGLGDTYGGASDMEAVAGQIFADQGVDLKKVEGDVEIVAYLQGFGDTTTDELNAAIQKNPGAFLSVGMATTFFAQQLGEAGISFSDIDAFTGANGNSMNNGTLTYLAGKYCSSIGPAFVLLYNAMNGNAVRDDAGNALSIDMGYAVATDSASFDKYYATDNGDTPIYDKASLDTIIGEGVTYQNVLDLVASK